MKIAIASTSKTLEGNISEKGGRSPFYLIFEDTNLIESIKNPFASGGGGAGWGVAKMLEDKKVEKVIVGKAGGNMKTAFEEAKIELIESSESISEYLKSL